jgi:hypothetical protein
MIKSIGDNYKIYGLIMVKTAKKLLMLDYGLSNTIFEPLNHALALIRCPMIEVSIIDPNGNVILMMLEQLQLKHV